MDPVNSVIIGLARIRSERRYQLYVEGKQNTIGVRAAGGGEGRMQRPNFEQIAYHSAKALGINYLRHPASRPNGPSWNNFNGSATNLPIVRNCWLYGSYEDYKYFGTTPRKKKKQNKTMKTKQKKNHFFNVMILTCLSRLINREQGMQGLNISDVVEERTVNPFCFSCNLVRLYVSNWTHTHLSNFFSDKKIIRRTLTGKI